MSERSIAEGFRNSTYISNLPGIYLCFSKDSYYW